MHKAIKVELIKNSEIKIYSGEGETGIVENYNGKRSIRAIKMRLTKEKCKGNRWAYARIYSHTNPAGDVYIDFDSNAYTSLYGI